MKDSQPQTLRSTRRCKYIKANNERFSTRVSIAKEPELSISRRIMKDSQPAEPSSSSPHKYIKANNERFSTT